jgi:hypothetical protein
MLHFELINKEWIVSRTARTVYRTAAVTSVFIFVALVALILESDRTNPLRLMMRPFLFLEAIAIALTLIGMEYFLFRFDDSHALTQMFWFCLLLLPPFGPALYCFLVYSRSEVVRACADQPAQISGIGS